MTLADAIVIGLLAFAIVVVLVALVQPRNDEFDNDNDRGMW